MKIPQGIKSCVAFAGFKKADGSYHMAGTVYFIIRDDNDSNLKYAITAKHVIEGIKSKGLDEIYLRINMQIGYGEWFQTKINDWKYHEDENVDVASFQMGTVINIDQEFYGLSGSMTKEIQTKHEIDEGDEVFITGLFKHHHGDIKNIPIVRVGNISSIPEEKIQTKNHLMDGYLIEARSIGGLSGSPVFVNLGLHRYIEKKIQQSNGGPIFFLIGMIYGHYDVISSEIDNITNDDTSNTDRINTGIAIVTPIQKVIEHLNKIELKNT